MNKEIQMQCATQQVMPNVSMAGNQRQIKWYLKSWKIGLITAIHLQSVTFVPNFKK
jgi:hypothetical protein